MAGLSGSLNDFDITDILQLIHMNKKEGCLEITIEDDKGYIYIQDWIVTHSETEDRKGEDAVQKILRWTKGSFEFVPEKKSDEKTVQVPIQHLMLEAARKIDEWQQIERFIPDTDGIIDIVENPETGTENIKLTSDEWKMLTFVDGELTIKELALKVNQSEFVTAKIFVGLMSSGLVYMKENLEKKAAKEKEKQEKIDKKKEKEKENKKKGLGRFFSR